MNDKVKLVYKDLVDKEASGIEYDIDQYVVVKYEDIFGPSKKYIGWYLVWDPDGRVSDVWKVYGRLQDFITSRDIK